VPHQVQQSNRNAPVDGRDARQVAVQRQPILPRAREDRQVVVAGCGERLRELVRLTAPLRSRSAGR
jgi:hypothetical protein